MTQAAEINLTVVLPTNILLTAAASEVYLNTLAGSYGILPHHVDFATALEPGVFEFRTPGGERRYVAMDGGAVVKQAAELIVTTPHGATSADLHELERGLRERFDAIDERERQMLAAMQRLEASLMHGLRDIARRERTA